jgi:hypothetical protein
LQISDLQTGKIHRILEKAVKKEVFDAANTMCLHALHFLTSKNLWFLRISAWSAKF